MLEWLIALVVGVVVLWLPFLLEAKGKLKQQVKDKDELLEEIKNSKQLKDQYDNDPDLRKQLRLEFDRSN